MKKRFLMLSLCCTAILFSQSVFFGAAGEPGTSADPVITESYVTNAINTVKKDVTSLTTRVTNLEKNGTSSGGLKQADVNVLLHISGMNPKLKYGAVNAKNVKLKASASDSSKNLATLPYFAGLTLLDAADGYIKVKYYDLTGWVPYDAINPYYLKS